MKVILLLLTLIWTCGLKKEPKAMMELGRTTINTLARPITDDVRRLYSLAMHI